MLNPHAPRTKSALGSWTAEAGADKDPLSGGGLYWSSFVLRGAALNTARKPIPSLRVSDELYSCRNRTEPSLSRL